MRTLRRQVLGLGVFAVTAMACSFARLFLPGLVGPEPHRDITDTATSAVATRVGQEADCLAPPASFEWAYEDLECDDWDDLWDCDAQFVVRNQGEEALWAIVAVAWDTASDQGRDWGIYPLEPATQWEASVKEAWLNKAAYFRVTHLLMLRNTPECKVLSEPGHESSWKSLATPIEPLEHP